jgi:hypothetical protein
MTRNEQNFILSVLGDLKQVRSALIESKNRADEKYNDSSISNNLYYAKSKLDDAMEDLELLIDEEE